MNRIIATISLLGMLLVTASAFAAEPVGQLTRTFGQVKIDSALAKTGDAFARGDTVSTGAKSLALLKFTDHGTIYLRADSAYRVDEYFYKKGQPKDGKYRATLLRGAMRSVTGLIGKGNAPAVHYETRVGTIGVRGTGFMAALFNGRLFLEVLSGCLDLQPKKAPRRDACKGEKIVLDSDGSILATGERARQMIETQRAFQNLRGARISGPGSVRSWGHWAGIHRASVKDNRSSLVGNLPPALLRALASRRSARIARLLSSIRDVVTLSSVDLDVSTDTSPPEFEDVGNSGDIRAQIVWTTTADIDLHLELPAGGGHVYYGNRTVSFNGDTATAELDADNLGGVINVPPDTRVENIYVTGSVPDGTYRFWARLFSGVDTEVKITATGDGGATSQSDNVPLSGTNRETDYYDVTRTGSNATYSTSPNPQNPN